MTSWGKEENKTKVLELTSFCEGAQDPCALAELWEGWDWAFMD